LCRVEEGHLTARRNKKIPVLKSALYTAIGSAAIPSIALAEDLLRRRLGAPPGDGAILPTTVVVSRRARWKLEIMENADGGNLASLSLSFYAHLQHAIATCNAITERQSPHLVS
jgi:hypothetical protein